METQDNEFDDILNTVRQRINNGGYGLGYIFDAIRSQPVDATTETPAITPLLVLENPQKLTSFHRSNMVLFNIPTAEDQSDYSWRVEDVFGNKGVLKIHRQMEEDERTGKKKVKFRWTGEESGWDLVDVDRVKDPHFVLDYIESCLNGKYALPF
jgi:hypothetical protein